MVALSKVTASLTGLLLAGGLAACQTMSGDSVTASGAGADPSTAIADRQGAPSAVERLSNPTNGSPAFVRLMRR